MNAGQDTTDVASTQHAVSNSDLLNDFFAPRGDATPAPSSFQGAPGRQARLSITGPVIAAFKDDSGAPRITIYAKAVQRSNVKYMANDLCLTTDSKKLEDQPQGQQWPKVFAGGEPEVVGNCPVPLMQSIDGQILTVNYYHKSEAALADLPNVGDTILLGNVCSRPGKPKGGIRGGVISATHLNANKWEVVAPAKKPGDLMEVLMTILKAPQGGARAALRVAQTFGCISSTARDGGEPGAFRSSLLDLDANAAREQEDFIKGLMAIRDKRLDAHDFPGTDTMLTGLITYASNVKATEQKLVDGSFGNDATVAHIGRLGSSTPIQIESLFTPDSEMYGALPKAFAAISITNTSKTDWALNIVANGFVVMDKAAVSEEMRGADRKLDGVLHQSSGLGSASRLATIGQRCPWEHLARAFDISNKEALQTLFNDEHSVSLLNGTSFCSKWQTQPAPQDEPAEMPNQMNKNSAFALLNTLDTVALRVSLDFINNYFLADGSALVGRTGEEYSIDSRPTVSSPLFNLTETTRTTMKKLLAGPLKSKTLTFYVLSSALVHMVAGMVSDPANTVGPNSVEDVAWCESFLIGQALEAHNLGDQDFEPENETHQAFVSSLFEAKDKDKTGSDQITIYCAAI